ncbi:hypothetical protein [Saccharophagus degradans]|uniref:Uncharacterized protein n=1 Tax=Saccharophagus degradans TaxID=86304 RepID=A0AAW7X3E3_9GAMM|nr:hypothetical protein [Saccharophagus degradans]MDO6422301.1 hypothetical protein [Saccharophagus degradans]MDO6609816.1 hypothetical protein [Saccharophagus degradans]
MDSANLKVNRAKKHLKELEKFLSVNKPFRYCVETNFKTGQRATFADRNEDLANDAGIIIGDIVHNLRAAMDHVYWECTESYSRSDGERKSIQFPISASEESLQKSVLPGLPKRVSAEFAQALESLNPHRGDTGNNLLYAIHDLDVSDKHKLLIPTGNFTQISRDNIKKELPDFPNMSGGFGNCRRDVVWKIQPMTWTQRRKAKIPPSNIIIKELNVEVTVVLNIEGVEFSNPVEQTVRELILEVERVIDVLRSACKH